MASTMKRDKAIYDIDGLLAKHISIKPAPVCKFQNQISWLRYLGACAVGVWRGYEQDGKGEGRAAPKEVNPFLYFLRFIFLFPFHPSKYLFFIISWEII